jgi:putative membrane protein
MRAGSLAAGVLVLVLLWCGPLQSDGRPFSAHMLIHMGVVAIAAPLLALALAGGRFDPVRKVPWLFSAIPASLLELVVVWGWHAPALHHAARQVTALWIAEQASFLLCGTLLWVAAFGGDRALDRGRRGAGVVALLLTSMHMTLLGALIALAPRPLYAHAGNIAQGALEDQQLGGAIMLLVGCASYLLGGLLLSLSVLRNASAREVT